jgi:hypothetical protein
MLYLEEKIENQVYTISLKSNGIIVGEFVKVDGFYYYSENKNKSWGLWSEEFLKSLVSELEILNKDINDSIDEYFNGK